MDMKEVFKKVNKGMSLEKFVLSECLAGDVLNVGIEQLEDGLGEYFLITLFNARTQAIFVTEYDSLKD